jgi:tetraacyldisaccharide 4'-kinase
MRAWSTPRWWYAEDRGGLLLRLLLTPPSWIWRWAGARRIARASPADVGCPVICVGNLTLGGAGKTPVAREVLRRLRARGVNAHGLSRGHGGRLQGPVRVDPALHTAAEVGDEPLMLAGDAPMWVARDRQAGARAARDAGAEAIVLDDGHQNPSLRKALSLVVVDGETRGGERPFGDFRVFPAGPMREPFDVGLERADAVVVLLPADLEAPDPKLLALFEGRPVLVARLEPAAPPPAGPQLGFAGVAKPWKVERSLKAAGCEVVDFAPFADHAPYSEADLAFLAARAETLGAGLVTTEKDWARLSPVWRARITAWPVRARFEDEASLDAMLDRAITDAAGGR